MIYQRARLLGYLLCLWVCVPASAQTIDGFRGIEWGDKPSTDFEVAERPRLPTNAAKLIRPTAVPYTRKSDKMRLGSLDVSAIHYWFVENKLRAVTIVPVEGNQSGDWVEVLSKVYGNNSQVPGSIGSGAFWSPERSVTCIYLDRPQLNVEPATHLTIFDWRDFKRQLQEKEELERARLDGVEKDF